MGKKPIRASRRSADCGSNNFAYNPCDKINQNQIKMSDKYFKFKVGASEGKKDEEKEFLAPGNYFTIIEFAMWINLGEEEEEIYIYPRF